MIIAKDLMTHHPWVLHTSDTVQHAVNMFTRNRPSTIPVLDSGGQVLGLLGEIPLMKIFVPLKVNGRLDSKLAEHKDLLEAPVFVRERDSIAIVVQACLKSAHHRVLVLDGMKHLRGMISPKDILTMLNGEANASITMQSELKDLRHRVSVMQEEHRKLAKVEAELQTYSDLIETSNFMFHSVDARGKIVAANERLHQVLGYNPGELIGKTINDLYPAEILPSVQSSLKELETPSNLQMNTSYKRKDGTHVKVELASHSITDAKGKFVATSTLSRLIDGDSLLRLLNGVI